MTSEKDLRQLLQEIIREELPNSMKQVTLATPIADEVLLTRAEMAKFLHISLVTLNDWVKRGLPAHKNRKSGRVLFIKADVLKWLRQKET